MVLSLTGMRVALARWIDAFLKSRRESEKVAAGLLAIAAIAALDYLTGSELSFSIFYLIPISGITWYTHRRLGLVMCVLGAATWLAVDVAVGNTYSHPAIGFWNAGVRLGFFVIITLLLATVRTALERQRSLAQLDGLTGVLNASAFRQRCDTFVHLAQRRNLPLTIGYIDLDDFKRVNDTLGHQAGDEVLRAVAAALVQRLRASDQVGRLGGDEFAVLLPETGPESAHVTFAGLRDRLLALADSQQWPIGFSIGVVSFETPAANTRDAICAADALMYRVKRSGKNAIRFETYPQPHRRAEDPLPG